MYCVISNHVDLNIFMTSRIPHRRLLSDLHVSLREPDHLRGHEQAVQAGVPERHLVSEANVAQEHHVDERLQHNREVVPFREPGGGRRTGHARHEFWHVGRSHETPVIPETRHRHSQWRCDAHYLRGHRLARHLRLFPTSCSALSCKEKKKQAINSLCSISSILDTTK